MDEKTIIKSEQTKKEAILVIGAIISLITGILYESLVFRFDRTWFIWLLEIGYMALAVFLLFFIYYWAIKKCELTITNKRAYGTAIFGKRVDLPIDSVSAVGTSLFKGIAIATSSGRISFIGIENRDAIHKAMSDLLIDRQSKPTASTTVKAEIPQSNADELKKYKELLDMGAISQEEFDAKKKQLLGL